MAALAIFLGHLPRVGGLPLFNMLKDAEARLPIGHLSMDVFFALSGFLITRIILMEREQGRFSLIRFYIRRSLRIMPIYYLALAVCLALFPLGKAEAASIAAYYSNFFYCLHRVESPLKHTWSLAVEEHFYLVWPLLLARFDRSQSASLAGRWVPGLAFAAAIGLGIFCEPRLFGDFLTRATPFRILSLALGAGMAFRERDPERVRWLSTLRIGLWTAAGIACIAVSHLIPHARVPFAAAAWLFSAALGFALVQAVVLLGPGNFFRRILESPPFVYLGKISYGLYLYHYIILFGLGLTHRQMHGEASLLRFGAAFGLCAAAPILSYHTVEAYFRKLRPRIA